MQRPKIHFLFDLKLFIIKMGIYHISELILSSVFRVGELQLSLRFQPSFRP